MRIRGAAPYAWWKRGERESKVRALANRSGQLKYLLIFDDEQTQTRSYGGANHTVMYLCTPLLEAGLVSEGKVAWQRRMGTEPRPQQALCASQLLETEA